MTKKLWERTSSKNEYEWKAKAIESDKGLLEMIFGTETFIDHWGFKRTVHHCSPSPSKILIKDLKKLFEKYEKKQKNFLNKSIKLLNKEMRGI